MADRSVVLQGEPLALNSLGLHFFEKELREGVVLFPAKGCILTETPAASGCLLQLRSEKNTPHGGGHIRVADCLHAPSWCGWLGEATLLLDAKTPGWKDLSCCSSDGHRCTFLGEGPQSRTKGINSG